MNLHPQVALHKRELQNIFSIIYISVNANASTAHILYTIGCAKAAFFHNSLISL